MWSDHIFWPTFSSQPLLFFHCIILPMVELFPNAKLFPEKLTLLSKLGCNQKWFVARGVSHFLIFLTWAGGWYANFWLLLLRGEEGSAIPQFLADILCEQPLKSWSHQFIKVPNKKTTSSTDLYEKQRAIWYKPWSIQTFLTFKTVAACQDSYRLSRQLKRVADCQN